MVNGQLLILKSYPNWPYCFVANDVVFGAAIDAVVLAAVAVVAVVAARLGCKRIVAVAVAVAVAAAALLLSWLLLPCLLLSWLLLMKLLSIELDPES